MPGPQLTGVAHNLSQAGLITITWVFFGVAAAFVVLRCYARLSESKRLFGDDYWIIAALTFLLINAILQTLQTPSLWYLNEVNNGLLGDPRENPKVAAELFRLGNIYVRYQFALIGIFWTITWFVKASFLTLYWRLFDGLPQYKRWWWAVVIFLPLAYIGNWISSVWTCHPPSAYFHFGSCTKPIDMQASVISISYTTAVDILTDLMIMCLPLGLLPSLQINTKQKVGLTGIFTVGIIVIAVAIVRLTQIVGTERTDPFGLALWGVIESSVSVIVGCLPALKSLLSRAVQSTFKRRYGTYGGPSQASARSDKKKYRGTDEEPFSKPDTEIYAIPLDESPHEVPSHYVSDMPRGQILVQKSYGYQSSIAASHEPIYHGHIRLPDGSTLV